MRGVGTRPLLIEPPGPQWRLDIGASVLEAGGVRFRVWAPKARSLSVRILGLDGKSGRLIQMEPSGGGFFETVAADARAGDRYLYLIDANNSRPDPASRYQPEGVHGPSEVVDPNAFRWDDKDWQGIPHSDYIFYELHAGTFTPEGTFDAAISRLGYLRELGITAVELMPVAEFPGSRNWGYDGAYPFAPQSSYGGPDGLKAFVNACHMEGLAVALDVVYNHLGPEGNYLGEFGHYFTDRYRTPWGDAINFDGPHSGEVRRYFIHNALYWLSEYHIDALRLDAVHGIYDLSGRHILDEMAEAVQSYAVNSGRHAHIIAESDLNDARYIVQRDDGGCGLDAQWNDDFHHTLHACLTGERTGYYIDFGTVGQIARAMSEGFVYSGQHSEFRKKLHGNSSRGLPAHRFVVFSQNHDQTGNRMKGDRLAATLSHDKLRLAAAAVLLSPNIPLLFMGEEYAETAPFPYFISHGDPALVEAVREGRKREFAGFTGQGDPPDPQSEAVFHSAKIDISLRHKTPHREIFAYYRELIRLRKSGLGPCESHDVKFIESTSTILLSRKRADGLGVCAFNFGEGRAVCAETVPGGEVTLLLDSSSTQWGGSGGSSVKMLDAGGLEITLAPYAAIAVRIMQGNAR